MKPSPAFQFYPSDFLTGTLDFTLEQRGAYMVLLCWQWEHGAIPEDAKKLRTILGAGEKKTRSIWTHVKKKFKLQKDGWRNDRLERVRQKQAEYRRLQAAKGRASAQQRLNRGSTEPQPEGQPRPQPNLNRDPNRTSTEGSTETQLSDLRTLDLASKYPDLDSEGSLSHVNGKDHRALARNSHKVLLRLGHDVLKERADTDMALSEFGAELKDRAAKANIPYDAESIRKAIDALRHTNGRRS